MEVVYRDGVKYQREEFLIESDFEEIVLSQYQHVFGKRAILFGKQKIKTTVGKGTIPDAYVICPDTKKWYVVEIELAIHSGYTHVAAQILKFRAAIKSDRKTLISFFDREIEADLFKKAKWQNHKGHHPDTHRELYNILENDPEILIIIDKHNEELIEAKSNLGFNVDILIFKCFNRFVSDRTDLIFQFEELSVDVRTKQPTTSLNVNYIKNAQTALPLSLNPIASKAVANKRVSKSSPSHTDWLKQVPELASVSNLNSWKDICTYLNLDVKADSARRVLQKWVAKDKPNWRHVPE